MNNKKSNALYKSLTPVISYLAINEYEIDKLLFLSKKWVLSIHEWYNNQLYVTIYQSNTKKHLLRVAYNLIKCDNFLKGNLHLYERVSNEYYPREYKFTTNFIKTLGL